MTKILCLDFGTSSIRASLLTSKNEQIVLPIGKTIQSQLDDASIRSDILVDLAGETIFLGERAIQERVSQKFLLYESSPKLWLKQVEQIKSQISQNSQLTREMLLTTLISYALSSCFSTGKISKKDLEKIDIRVSHPIWPEDIAYDVNKTLNTIIKNALSLYQTFNKDSLDVKTVINKLSSHSIDNQNLKINTVDVLEPIAAALTLIPEIDNIPRICAVVDIGAGTTDIGLFQVVYPDETSDKNRSLIPIGNAVSLFSAGNMIDETLLEVITEKANNNPKIKIRLTDETKQEIKTRIRQIKESLFNNEIIREAETNITLREFSSHPNLISLCSEIRNAIQNIISPSEGNAGLNAFYTNRYIQCLDIIMGGGGSSMGFVTSALKKSFSFGNQTLSTSILKPTRSDNFETFGATIERLAVSLGGAHSDYESLNTKFTEPKFIRLGSM